MCYLYTGHLYFEQFSLFSSAYCLTLHHKRKKIFRFQHNNREPSGLHFCYLFLVLLEISFY
jgi:hypothetical protein